MYLSGTQISELATQINAEFSIEKLRLLASDIGINLENEWPGLSLLASAFNLLSFLNGQVPSRIDVFLETLTPRANARLRATIDQILTPAYYSPNGEPDPYKAILLGRAAFIDRQRLRELLRNDFHPTPFSTRVLVVSGNKPGGKSYSWEFIRHLAQSQGAEPQRLRLRRTSYTPREFFEQVYRLLGWGEKTQTLPELKDDPQLARIDPLLNALKGELNTLNKRYWLVVDDLNEPSVTQAVRESAFALASTVEDAKPQNLWVVLLGYNDTIDDSELRFIAKDDAEFPSQESIAKHLELVSQISANPLPPERAKEMVSVLFSKYGDLDRGAMIKITSAVEVMGEKLKQGLQP